MSEYISQISLRISDWTFQNLFKTNEECLRKNFVYKIARTVWKMDWGKTILRKICVHQLASLLKFRRSCRGLLGIFIVA